MHWRQQSCRDGRSDATTHVAKRRLQTVFTQRLPASGSVPKPSAACHLPPDLHATNVVVVRGRVVCTHYETCGWPESSRLNGALAPSLHVVIRRRRVRAIPARVRKTTPAVLPESA